MNRDRQTDGRTNRRTSCNGAVRAVISETTRIVREICCWLFGCRREELFRDADSFKPERFLRQQTDVDEPNTYHYVPFIYGPSQCLGYRFAGVEMRALLAILLHQFQFEVDPDGPVVYKRRLTLSMRPDPPLHLKVSLIDPSWAH